MTDGAPNPLFDELLSRLVTLEDRATSEDTIQRSLKDLSDRLTRVETKMQQRAASAMAFNQALMDDRTVHTGRLNELAERIKGLEVTVFPSLLKDIDRLYRIIGGDGVPVTPNPLDTRKKSPN